MSGGEGCLMAVNEALVAGVQEAKADRPEYDQPIWAVLLAVGPRPKVQIFGYTGQTQVISDVPDVWADTSVELLQRRVRDKANMLISTILGEG